MSVHFPYAQMVVLNYIKNFSNIRVVYAEKLKKLKEASKPGAPAPAPAPTQGQSI
jgi:hypothetical protein